MEQQVEIGIHLAIFTFTFFLFDANETVQDSECIQRLCVLTCAACVFLGIGYWGPAQHRTASIPSSIVNVARGEFSLFIINANIIMNGVKDGILFYEGHLQLVSAECGMCLCCVPPVFRFHFVRFLMQQLCNEVRHFRFA